MYLSMDHPASPRKMLHSQVDEQSLAQRALAPSSSFHFSSSSFDLFSLSDQLVCGWRREGGWQQVSFFFCCTASCRLFQLCFLTGVNQPSSVPSSNKLTQKAGIKRFFFLLTVFFGHSYHRTNFFSHHVFRHSRHRAHLGRWFRWASGWDPVGPPGWMWCSDAGKRETRWAKWD